MNGSAKGFLLGLSVIGAAVLLLVIGIAIGKNDGLPITAFLASPTTTASVTPTKTRTSTPRPTSTPKPTRTPTPTNTPTPTLYPGQFVFQSSEIRESLWDELGIECYYEGGESELGGYFWECRGKSERTIIRAVFYGPDAETTEYMLVYVLNIFNPTHGEAWNYMDDFIKSAFEESTAEKISRWVGNNLIILYEQGLDAPPRVTQIQDYPISLTGPGICRVLRIGNEPAQGIDREIIFLIGEIELFCGLDFPLTPTPDLFGSD